jgi:hypothetical protein
MGTLLLAIEMMNGNVILLCIAFSAHLQKLCNTLRRPFKESTVHLEPVNSWKQGLLHPAPRHTSGQLSLLRAHVYRESSSSALTPFGCTHIRIEGAKRSISAKRFTHDVTEIQAISFFNLHCLA